MCHVCTLCCWFTISATYCRCVISCSTMGSSERARRRVFSTIHSLMLCVLQIDVEKYRVTLYLARKYNLDCDLVYQRQWHNSSFSVTSILLRQYSSYTGSLCVCPSCRCVRWHYVFRLSVCLCVLRAYIRMCVYALPLCVHAVWACHYLI